MMKTRKNPPLPADIPKDAEPHNKDREPLLTPKQVAERLSCSVSVVHGLYYGGKLPAIPVGAGENPHRRYRESDVEAFIRNSRTVKTPFVPSDPRIDEARQEYVKSELRKRGHNV